MLEDGRFVLINRGFVPYEKKDPSTRIEGQIDGPVNVTGLARDPLSAKPGFFSPDNDPSKNIFYWKDWTAMAESADLPNLDEVVPFFIDADSKPNPGIAGRRCDDHRFSQQPSAICRDMVWSCSGLDRGCRDVAVALSKDQ